MRFLPFTITSFLCWAFYAAMVHEVRLKPSNEFTLFPREWKVAFICLKPNGISIADAGVPMWHYPKTDEEMEDCRQNLERAVLGTNVGRVELTGIVEIRPEQ